MTAIEQHVSTTSWSSVTTGTQTRPTARAWQVERTNWEPEIPRRHWHLNDPGVVPNVLITGAGSPTGITVYEGNLLPEKFRNQVIHCDAGPNVVRSYIAKADGAGYSATIEDIAVGEFDKWFRPADVCVAPDGSLFVSDWYDPGVGGHNMEDMERGPIVPYRSSWHQVHRSKVRPDYRCWGCRCPSQSMQLG